MKIDMRNHLPMGICWEEVRNRIGLGLGGSGVWTLGVLIRYVQARNALFSTNLAGERVLIQGAKIAPFAILVQGMPLAAFGCYFAALLVLAGYYYLYHRMGSMSIYLMKRLPNHWELHRRCWTVPVLAALVGIALAGALIGVYYCVYRFCTPAQCLI